MEAKKLTPAQCKQGKYRNRQPSRSGYADEKGMCFLPPSNAKRVEQWKAMLREKGYEIS